MTAEWVETLAHPADATLAYLTGQMQASQGPLLAAYAAESAAAVAAYSPRLDLAYGSHPREVFDLYISKQPWRGTLAYFHAGYWQSRDKSQFHFLAPAFLDEGIDVALVNYPLCPSVTLEQLTESARASIAAILAKVLGLGRGGATLTAAGHSAGGHLAAELAMTDWRARGAPDHAVASILAISGVYELTPLLATALNDKLKLDLVEARAQSPIRRIRGPLPPALFVAGGAETPEFQLQTRAMASAWRASGSDASCEIVAGADHFSVLRAFGNDGSLLDTACELIAKRNGQA